MTQIPDFEIEEDHEYKPREKVYVRDQNGYDIYEGTIVSIELDSIKVRMTDDNKDIRDLTREDILPNNRKNHRIFMEQDQKRAQDGFEEEEEEKPKKTVYYDDDLDDDEDDFDDESDDDEPRKKKKGQKPRKSRKDKPIKPRPAGARSNPRRGTTM